MHLKILRENLEKILGKKIKKIKEFFGELTITIHKEDYLLVAKILRDSSDLAFEQLIDLCAVDYSEYKNTQNDARFSVIVHLLSLNHNWRIRICIPLFENNKKLLLIPSLVSIWNSACWFEREAFDLFGIIFEGHDDLRRILTDYGFIGYPFRKDFPVSGYTEVKYDSDQKRVIYQLITIEPREVIPRTYEKN